jgi:hypothetical protein
LSQGVKKRHKALQINVLRMVVDIDVMSQAVKPAQ